MFYIIHEHEMKTLESSCSRNYLYFEVEKSFLLKAAQHHCSFINHQLCSTAALQSLLSYQYVTVRIEGVVKVDQASVLFSS